MGLSIAGLESGSISQRAERYPEGAITNPVAKSCHQCRCCTATGNTSSKLAKPDTDTELAQPNTNDFTQFSSCFSEPGNLGYT